MKKLTFSLILAVLLGFTANVKSQIPYYDALKLEKLLSGGKWPAGNAQVNLILRQYLKSDMETVGSQFYDNNPFTHDYFGVARPLAAEGPLQSAITSAGNLDVTTLADGFAKFLVARTKEELSVAFFSRFKDLLNDPNYQDARLLFPQTWSTLNTIGDQIYNYPAYLNALREAFEEDLNGLPADMESVINDGREAKFFTLHPLLKAVTLSSLYISDGLLLKKHPSQIIADYDVTSLDAVDVDIKGSVQTLQILSQSIRSESAGNDWISEDSLKLLVQDPVALNIFWGLIYQEAEGVAFSGGVTLQGVLNTARSDAQKIATFVSYLTGFEAEAGIVVVDIKNLEGKDASKLQFTDYYKYYNSTLDLIVYASNIYKLSGLNALKPTDETQSYFRVLRTGGNLALDIDRRNYSSAVMDLSQLYSFTFTVNKADAMSGAIKDSTDHIKNFLMRYGSFIASVVQAQNSDDVEKAIEAAALPAGSSAIKRHSCFDISLNAYLGGFLGNEVDQPAGAPSITNSVYGVNAPIGIAISTSFYPFCLTAFGSIVDIGAVTAYRAQSDTVSNLPDFKLANIIAPGGYIILGVSGFPISLGAGWQKGPQLRSITAATASLNTLQGFRRSVFLAVDIPLMDFYNKPSN